MPVCSDSPGYVEGGRLLTIATFVDRLKHRLDTLLDPRPGQRLLDIGSGPGVDTVRLAEAVGRQGAVVGVDIDADMVAMADARAVRSGMAARVTHIVGDATRLPCPSNAFDGCRCERTLQHVSDPSRAVAEMARVTREGGTIVAADSDWASLSIHVDDPPLERRIVGAVGESFRHGYAGRQLRDLCVGAGLTDVIVEPWIVHWTDLSQFSATSFMSAGIHDRLVREGRISGDEWTAFRRLLERADARDGFFASAVIVVVVGTKSTRRRRATGREGQRT